MLPYKRKIFLNDIKVHPLNYHWYQFLLVLTHFYIFFCFFYTFYIVIYFYQYFSHHNFMTCVQYQGRVFAIFYIIIFLILGIASIFLFIYLFWPYHTACWILVPLSGTEPTTHTLETQSLNYWSAREVPSPSFPVHK